MISKVKHQRGMLERLEELETRRDQIEQELASGVEENLDLRPSQGSLERFLGQYRRELKVGDLDRKKAALRALIDHALLDGDDLTIVPATERFTRVKMASPTGFEPVSPP